MDESWSSSSVNPAEYSTVCACRRSFAQLNAYANHQQTCKKRKKHLSNALVKAKEVWMARKRPCREAVSNGLAGFTPPPTFGHIANAQTPTAVGDGLRPQLVHGFAGSESSAEEAAINDMQCNGNPGSGSGQAVTEVENNVSVTMNSSSIS